MAMKHNTDDPIYELAELGCGIKPQDSHFTLRRRAEDAEMQARSWRLAAVLILLGWAATLLVIALESRR